MHLVICEINVDIASVYTLEDNKNKKIYQIYGNTCNSSHVA